MRSILFASFIASVAAATGCSAYDPDLGSTPYLCADTDPPCPDGYSCQDAGGGNMVCLAGGATPPADAPPSFICADDSLLEGNSKNDTIQNAYATPVASQRNEIAFAGLAICPAGDKDTYLITLNTISNIEVITSWEEGMPVSVSILNNGGTSLNNGTSNGERSLRAFVANMPAGTYYAQAYAAVNVQNNYRIEIKVSQ